MKSLDKRLGIVCSGLALMCSAAAGDARSADDAILVRSLLPPGAQHAALRRAVIGARLRLARPECQRVFSEFSDASGQTLQARLDAQGRTAASYLSLIVFADGGRLRSCQNPNTFAVTEPGSRVVHICGSQFSLVAVDNPRQAEAFLIHEELHSLGLRENPPSPKEITDRVLEQCRP